MFYKKLFLLIGLLFLTACAASRPFDDTIAKDAISVWTEKDALYSYVKKFGPKESIQHLHDLAYNKKMGDCHTNAHEAGRFAYEIYDDKAFQLCSSECHSGCYHGATEAYFAEHGTADLAGDLKLLCSSELNAFFSHQCVHGIGHGLMAFSDYEMFDALESCDLLDQRQTSCYTGVFMENIVGGLAKADAEKAQQEGRAEDIAHYTDYLNDDPLFPCNHPGLTAKYRGSCYFLQTSRMTQLYGPDFEKVAKACATAPEEHQRDCFESMGRDVGGTLRGRPDEEIKSCSYAPQGSPREGCIAGAVQDAFWDPSGQDAAIKFCTMVKDVRDKEVCYKTIFARAPEILKTEEEQKAFCGKAEPNYQYLCK